MNRVSLWGIGRSYNTNIVQAVPTNVIESLSWTYSMERRVRLKLGDGLVFACCVAYFQNVLCIHTISAPNVIFTTQIVL